MFLGRTHMIQLAIRSIHIMWVTWLFQPPKLLCQANRIRQNPWPGASGFGESGKGIQLVSQHKLLISTAYHGISIGKWQGYQGDWLYRTTRLSLMWFFRFGFSTILIRLTILETLKRIGDLLCIQQPKNLVIDWRGGNDSTVVPRSSIQDMTTSRPYCLETLWPLATAMLGYPELDWMSPFRIHIQLYHIYIYIHRQCEGTAWTKNAWTFLLTFNPWKNQVWICEYLWGRTFPSCPTQAWFVGWSLAFILDWKISITQCNASGVECEDSSGHRLGRSEICKPSWTYTILYIFT